MKTIILLLGIFLAFPALAGPVTDLIQDSVVVQQLDAVVLDTASTNLNGSAGAQVTVVASMNQDTVLCRVNDQTGAFIGVFVAGALVFQITPGMDSLIRCPIARGAAVTMRSTQATAVTGGKLVVQFMK